MAEIHDQSGEPVLLAGGGIELIDKFAGVDHRVDAVATQVETLGSIVADLGQKSVWLTEIVGREQGKLQDLGLVVERLSDASEHLTARVEENHQTLQTAMLEVGQEVEDISQRLDRNEVEDLETTRRLVEMIDTTRGDFNRALKILWSVVFGQACVNTALIAAFVYLFVLTR